MKRLLTLFVIAVLAILSFSCKKEKINSQEPIVYINEIKVDANYSLSLGSSTGFLPVSVNPSKASLKKNASVSCNPDDVISCHLTDKGVEIDPKKVGTTTLTITSKADEEVTASCLVTVTPAPLAPKSIEIVKEDSHFQDGALTMVAGETFQLSAKIKNVNDAVTSEYGVVWSVEEGGQYINLNTGTGEVEAKPLGGASNPTIKVKASVEGHSAIYDIVTVKILKAPTSMAITVGTSLYAFNPQNELIVKVGVEGYLYAGFQPSGSLSVINVEVSDNSVLKVNIDGDKITYKGLKVGKTANSAPYPVKLTITSQYNPNLKDEINVYVANYDFRDLKAGDWVYYCSTNGKFISKDSGRRYDGFPLTYVNDDDTRTTEPMPFPGNTVTSGGNTYKYIGVVASTGGMSDSDFMNCSHLSRCRDGSNATGLYGLKDFRKSDLPGINNSLTQHALVIRKSQSAKDVWQAKTECIATTTAKKDGLYQYQLTGESGHFAFSSEMATKLTNKWKAEYEQTGASNPPTCNYPSSGFVSFLLQKFYNNHLNDNGYRVIPVYYIEQECTDVPQLALPLSGKSTGWFVPGNNELSAIVLNAGYLNPTLLKSGYQSITDSDHFWTTLETEATEAKTFCMDIGSLYKTRDKSSFQAKILPVLYL